MASLEHRVQGTKESWRVIWREDRLKQQETFPDEPAALEFKESVESNGNHWPAGWVKGVGPADYNPNALTFEAWCEHVLDTNVSATGRTIADYRRDLRNHVYPLLGRMPLEEIGRIEVADWVRGLKQKNLAAKTVANVHAMASGLLTVAVDEGKIERNPMKGTLGSHGSGQGSEMTFLLPREVQLIARFIPEPYRTIVHTLAGTGMRWGEITALRVQDVDVESKRATIRIHAAWKRQADNSYQIGEPKTRRSRRTIVIGSELIGMLKPLIIGRDPSDFLFESQLGRHITHENFYRNYWKPAVSRAQVCAAHAQLQMSANGRLLRHPKPCDCAGVLKKRPRIHDLRHTHASWLIAEGVAPIAISRRLGHASITTTFDRYGHLMPEMDDAINTAVDKAMMYIIDEDEDQVW